MTFTNTARLAYPESVSVKRCPDGTYIYYALIYAESEVNGKTERSLCSLKSENLRFQTDLEMGITIENNYIGSVRNCFQYLTSKSLVHNLAFKSIGNKDGVLFTLMVMDKGDEEMNYNIFETNEAYEVQVSAPGYNANELSVYLEDGIIHIKAKPKKEEEDDKEIVVRNFAKAKRELEVYLPNSESASAELKNGILYITVPKKSKGLKVEIKTA